MPPASSSAFSIGRRALPCEGPRAQADRRLYREAMQAALAGDRQSHPRRRRSAETRCRRMARSRRDALVGGGRLACAAAVLDDRHVPQRDHPLRGDDPACGTRRRCPLDPALAHSLARHGFRLGRLKTGTPPRLDGRTIDWASLERQSGDPEPEPFSFLTREITNPQVDCFVTQTTAAGHRIIEDNIGLSAVYSGAISGLRAALLPVDRGQDHPLPRAAVAPDLPGAGRARRSDGLSQRYFDLAAGRRAGPVSAHHPRPRSCHRAEARLCHRVRLHRSARADAVARDEARRRALPRRPDQRHDRLRGGRRARPRRRSQRRAARRRPDSR